MGAEQSKELKAYSTEELAECLDRRGPKFSAYSDEVKANGVDGAFLDALDENELADTLEDVGVTSRLHARMLTKEWSAAKEFRSQATGEFPPPLVNIDTARTENSSFVSLDATSNSAPVNIHSVLAASKSYQIDHQTPPKELESFDNITSKAMEEFDAIYAGIHLIDEKGHMSVSSRTVFPDGSKSDSRMHSKEKSLCHCYILDGQSDYVQKQVDGAQYGYPFLPSGQAEYVGKVLRGSDGKRVAMVCTVTQAKVDEETKQALMSDLAAEAEQQLQLRKILLQRNERLTQQLDEAKMIELSEENDDDNNNNNNNDSDIVTPAFELVEPVTRAQIESRRASLIHNPDDIAKRGTNDFHSRVLPSVVAGAATEAGMKHLPDDYYEELRAMGGEDTPVPRNDEERVAFVESLGLTKIDPDGPTSQALRRLTHMAASLFDTPYVDLTVPTHDKLFGLSRHIQFSSAEQREWFYSVFYPEILNHSSDGTPALCAKGRAGAVCNYPLTIKKTFVVKDLWADKSFEYLKQIGMRFYTGIPVFINGFAVAVLCIVDWKAHPEFGLAQELQAEQIAKLIEQQLENYVLRSEMLKLENDRLLLASSRTKTKPPEDKAALIFTDVQGSTRLWEANGDAMHEALQIHDKIMRKCCSEHNGYEIITEGDAFHMAFHDAIDAANFALKAQEELHNADWSDEILSCPDACEDKQGSFRGLRVRMAIHFGDVKSRENGVSGRLEYIGDTYHIAKSLEHMSHGGQILVSDAVWSVASYVSESSLGSPQVLDLGTHVLWRGKLCNEGVVVKNVFQLVPSSLAFDYFQNRKKSEPVPNADKIEPAEPAEGGSMKNSGRQFPPVLTQKQCSRSFHDAPYNASHNVAMCFIYTTEIENRHEDASLILLALTKLVGSLVFEMKCSGYQCKNFMLAFPSSSRAVDFGLRLQEELSHRLLGGAEMKGLVKIGVHEGFFTSMGPCPSSGRADYYGKVVNRAARVAGAAEPGGVWLGKPAQGDNSEDPLGSGLAAEFVHCRSLKGVSEEMALYSCTRLTQA